MKTLSPARAWWKAYWRQLRTIRRETYKAAMDVPDFIRHVPLDEWATLEPAA